MKEKVHLILNPVAGGGKAGKLKKLLSAELYKRFGKEFSLQETDKRGDAIKFAREAAGEPAMVIIAAGGDGTVNEVINGILTANSAGNNTCELAIINCGSGNGLAQTLGLPSSINEQLDLISGYKAKPVDVGFVFCPGKGINCIERYFISECQVGIGGSVVSKVGFRLKQLGGKLAFGTIAISQLSRYKASEIKLSLDSGTFSGKAIGVTIGNGIFCAGGMKLTPGALIDDGFLDVLGIRDMNLLKRFLNFAKVYSGDHVRSGYFSLTKSKEIYLESSPPVWIEADGELIGQTPCRMGIVPGAIKIRY